MYFNSLEFAIFLPIVFGLVWALPRRAVSIRNVVLLLASYVFYAFWDWRFLSLILISSAVDYIVGRRLERCDHAPIRKCWLGLSLLVNLGVLGFFKYFNFFVESFAEAVTWFGQPISWSALSIVLPAGISFYTFQTLGYSIDVYERKASPTRDPLAFFTFVSFFPQLVAGPIERTGDLLPQFAKWHAFDFDRARDGMRQILWGLFTKCVIADNCGRYVDIIFDDYANLPASALAIGAVLFGFQIYGDFSGYSNIAIGVAKLLGFRLSRNFHVPYFASDPIDFWRRWHITLSTWFRDYVYIPLGGNRGGRARTVRNLLVVFAVSGLWHGAAWTFVVWGLYHAAGVIVTSQWHAWSQRDGKRRLHFVRSDETVSADETMPADQTASGAWTRFRLRALFARLFTFLFVTAGWIFFRSDSLADAAGYFVNLCSFSILTPTGLFPRRIALLIAIMMMVEWVQRDQKHGLDFDNRPVIKPLRWVTYQVLVILIYGYGVTEQSFIYFEF